MVTANLAHAKAHLSELLDKVEAGEKFVLTRHGRPVARILAASPKKLPIPFEELAAFRATLRPMQRSSAEILRELRDEGL